MATKTYIKFNSAGFRAILMSGGTRAAVNDAASRMVSAAAFGPKVRIVAGGYGGGRMVGFVATKAKTPKEAEEQRKALESAVVGGGG